jgi:hypothetical protein
VGWMLAYRESAELGKRLIEQTIERQNICSGTLKKNSPARSKILP